LKTHTSFFLFKISSIGIYTGTVPEKLPKTPLFGPSLIHQLLLLGSQQHPQSGVLLTSFSTWGPENSLVKINLESTGVIKGSKIFCGQKLANTCSFVGRRIIVQQEKISRAERRLTNPALGGDPLLLSKILHLLFSPLVRILCALCLESRKKLSTWS
jgi:hypothetical protein